MRSKRHFAACLVAALTTGLAAQDAAIETEFREDVRVDLAQVEITVWPEKGDDPTACRGLTRDDFEVTVSGRASEIVAADWLGSIEATPASEGHPISEPSPPALSLVLFFDLWHLNVFHRDFDCPMTRPLAFDEARRLVREEFRAGDRLLLVTFAGWPQIHGGWIREPRQALRALDRLEVNPFVMSARQTHSHHQEWMAGVQSLLLALGRYPGRKDVFYLGDDFRFDDVAMQVYDLAARAQVNQVSMHAVDLLVSCRDLRGPGCPDTPRGGLGCTPFARPLALGYVAKNTGGLLYRHAELAPAVRNVRQMHGCRYLISIPVTRPDRKRSPSIVVRVRREGLQLHHPSSFGTQRREPSERERQDALFLLPRFGAGLNAEVGLWPLRPTGQRDRWRGVMIARLGRAVDEPWTEAVERIEVQALAHRGSRIYGEFRKVLEGEELERFRNSDEPRLFVFPLDKIPSGVTTVSLRAQSVGGDVSANVRATFEVPRPPGPGTFGPWFLVDRLARIGEQVTVVPALDGVLAHERQALLVGFGCRGTGPGWESGRLMFLDGDEDLPAPIDWLDPPGEGSVPDACGWLAARVGPDLTPGLWRFEPPAVAGAEDNARAGVEFRVADAPAAAGPIE